MRARNTKSNTPSRASIFLFVPKGVSFKESELIRELVEARGGKGFGELIGDVVLGGDLGNLELVSFDMTLN